MKILSLLLAILAYISVSAQCDKQIAGPVNAQPNIKDGIYLKTQVPTKRIPTYEGVREADVIWSKRVWRTIDLREKMNLPLFFPLDSYDASNIWQKNSSRWSLFTILKHGILTGDLVMYSPYNPAQFTMIDGDEFKYPVTEKNGKNYCNDSTFRDQVFYYLGNLGEETTVPLQDIDGNDSTVINNGATSFVYPPRDTNWIISKDIVQYKLKEDWFFDKERSVLDVRILGIAPVMYQMDAQNQVNGTKELFWLYFPECRFLLGNYFYYNSQNDASQISFDDLFWKRNFTSTIYKESNVFDRKIESYKTGVDALWESNRITEGIRNFEHDVWSF
jgi:gliding motility associated protien GldN